MIIIYSLLGLQILLWVLKWWALLTPLDAETLKLLKEVDPWYDQMDAKNRRKFKFRFNDFIRTTKFIFKEGVPVDKQPIIKKTVASAAARLAYRLSKKAFDQYDRLIIYEHSYYSTINHHYHKGEVNPGVGFIVLTYQSMVDGYEKKDGINLVYHELAHALWLEHKLYSYDVFKGRDFDAYEGIARQEWEHSKANEDHFFRRYAFANQAEFFAVAVENFFERPVEFKQTLPDLYASLARLFKQDFTLKT